jgi:hypothetical protein
MVRRISPSQFRSQLQQAENRRRQEIERQVRNYNQNLNRVKQAIVDNVKREARAHNARVEANRRRILSALTRLQNRPNAPGYGSFKVSVNVLHSSYVRLEERFQYNDLSPYESELLDLSQQEAANSVEIATSLLDPTGITATHGASDLENKLHSELIVIAPDLDSRWRGALFALNPQNPDAARHFCSSTREIFTQVLDIGAPDPEVTRALPTCKKTDEGKPTRRAKIEYCLQRNGIAVDAMTDFVDDDIQNIIDLFKMLNTGTHGSAGVFDVPALRGIKKRAEDGIIFLSKIVRPQG